MKVWANYPEVLISLVRHANSFIFQRLEKSIPPQQRERLKKVHEGYIKSSFDFRKKLDVVGLNKGSE